MINLLANNGQCSKRRFTQCSKACAEDVLIAPKSSVGTAPVSVEMSIPIVVTVPAVLFFDTVER